MSPQLNYNEQANSFAGMRGDNREGVQVVTAVNADVVSIPFGVFVVASAAGTYAPGVPSLAGTPLQVQLPSGSGNDFANGGFVMQSHEYDKRLDLDTVGVVVARQLNVMRRGSIWVVAEQAMLKTDPVFVRYTANGAGKLVGQVRKDADTGKATQLWGAKVLSEITAAGNLLIEFDMLAYQAGAVHS